MGATRVTGVVAAAAASIVLLSGCVQPSSAPPSGVSAEELARYQEYSAQQMWEFTRLPAEARPVVEVEYVEVEEWSESFRECDGLAEMEMDAGAAREDAIITEYTCRMRPQLRAGDLSLLNEAQLDYLYDYYQDHLIPCMRIHGADVYTVLTRDEAVDIGRFGDYPWNPYGEVWQLSMEDSVDVAVWNACPAFPPDSIFDKYWTP